MSTILILLGVVIGAAVVARIITRSAGYATTKVCDACKSRVPKDARKCAHCGEDFAPES